MLFFYVSFYVSIDDLSELLETCQRVKANHGMAYELLPVQSGCFFGSTNYDEWYWEDIDNTIEIIEDLLAEPIDHATIYYQASW